MVARWAVVVARRVVGEAKRARESSEVNEAGEEEKAEGARKVEQVGRAARWAGEVERAGMAF